MLIVLARSAKHHEARASSSHQCFLHPCSLPFPGTVGTNLPFVTPDGRLGSVVLAKGKIGMPIDGRSWTLQEHLLSRRVLRFTDFRLHWLCRKENMHEGPLGDSRDDTSALPPEHTYQLSRADSMYQSILNEKRSCEEWMYIVEQYTYRRLTDVRDKLPATPES